MFAYCGNNPVANKDETGEFWSAIIGGAIAGAIIGAVSNIVSQGLDGEPINGGEVVAFAVVGAVTGAIGAAAGVVETARTACSAVVGLISGVAAAIATEGTVGEKIGAGIKTAAVATVGTYLGAGIPTLKDCGRIAEGMTAFAGTLFSGTQTELINAFIS